MQLNAYPQLGPRRPDAPPCAHSEFRVRNSSGIGSGRAARPQTSDLQPLTSDAAWYCLRSQPKHEHIAAAILRRLPDLEVFHPRLRLRKGTLRGPVWFTEPLFPGYLFARFKLPGLIEKVRYAFGVAEVVHFGTRWPVVPDDVIHNLQATFGGAAIHELPLTFQPGDEVRIARGPFMGLAAIVHRHAPASQRVQLLLELLGRSIAVELDVRSVAGRTRYPGQLAAP